MPREAEDIMSLPELPEELAAQMSEEELMALPELPGGDDAPTMEESVPFEVASAVRSLTSSLSGAKSDQEGWDWMQEFRSINSHLTQRYGDSWTKALPPQVREFAAQRMQGDAKLYQNQQAELGKFTDDSLSSTAANAAAGGFSAIGEILGGEVGAAPGLAASTVSGPVGVPLMVAGGIEGAKVGKEGAEFMSEDMGLAPRKSVLAANDPSIPPDEREAAAAEQMSLSGRLLDAATTFGEGDLADAGVGLTVGSLTALRPIIKWAKQWTPSAWKRRQRQPLAGKEGSIASNFAGGKRAGAEDQLAHELYETEESFVKSGVLQSLNPSSDDLLGDLSKAIDDKLSNALEDKARIVERLSAPSAPKARVGTPATIKSLLASRNRRKMTPEVEDQLGKTIAEYYPGNMSAQTVTLNHRTMKGFLPPRVSGGEIELQLRRIQDRLEELRTFDNSVQARMAQGNDSALAPSMAEIQSLRMVRDHLREKLQSTARRYDQVHKTRLADRLTDANGVAHAMLEYRNPVQRARSQAMGIMNQPSISLNENMRGGALRGTARFLTAGASEQIGEGMRARRAMRGINEPVERALEMVTQRANPTKYQTLADEFAASPGAMMSPAAGVAAEGIAEGDNEGEGASEFVPFTRSPDDLSDNLDELNAASVGAVTPEIEEALMSGTDEEKLRAAGKLASAAPIAFEPPPIPGYRSMVKGVITDPLEKEAANRRLEEVFRGDTAKRMQAKLAINRGEAVPDFAILALGGQGGMAQLSAQEKFLSEAEGGQRLDGYHPGKGFADSGVTVATGIDLGGKSVDELRSLDLPEPLVAKLSPYLGLVGEAAQKKLANYPLNLSPDEAVALDQAVMNRDKGVLEEALATHGIVFEDFPEEVQTVVRSMAHNFGPRLDKELPSFWKKIVNFDWDGLHDLLIRTKWKQKELTPRRRKEAMLLTKLIQVQPSPVMEEGVTESTVSGTVEGEGGAERQEYEV